mmetsp:Transcript_23514/g.23759  ORF Transcript_23514/g.23759 Transcript_23514/m.23759 type:complete len:96 (+) Transcript_23514:94-381(+)
MSKMHNFKRYGGKILQQLELPDTTDHCLFDLPVDPQTTACEAAAQAGSSTGFTGCVLTQTCVCLPVMMLPVWEPPVKRMLLSLGSSIGVRSRTPV